MQTRVNELFYLFVAEKKNLSSKEKEKVISRTYVEGCLVFFEVTSSNRNFFNETSNLQ